MNFGVSSITNPTDRTFVHTYDGQTIEIKAGATVQLPENVARDAAYHLAQRVLASKGIGFYGNEHEDCIEELIGNKEPSYFGTAKEEPEEEPLTGEGSEESEEEPTVKKQAPRGFMKKK
jgi:hypothetical protein